MAQTRAADLQRLAKEYINAAKLRKSFAAAHQVSTPPASSSCPTNNSGNDTKVKTKTSKHTGWFIEGGLNSSRDAGVLPKLTLLVEFRDAIASCLHSRSLPFASPEIRDSKMVFGFSVGDLLLVGLAVAVLGPKDVALVARTAGKLTGKAVAYVQKGRNQFGDILQRSQANQVHNELRETMAQLEAIRHEIHTGMSIMNPGPMTREVLNSAATGVRGKTETNAEGLQGGFASSFHVNVPPKHTAVTSKQAHHQPGQVAPTSEFRRPGFTLPQEMLQDSSFSEWVNAPAAEPKIPVDGRIPAEGAQGDDIVVLPISAVDAGLLPDKKGGIITGADIVLESVIERRVALQALEFFEHHGAVK